MAKKFVYILIIFMCIFLYFTTEQITINNKQMSGISLHLKKMEILKEKTNILSEDFFLPNSHFENSKDGIQYLKKSFIEDTVKKIISGIDSFEKEWMAIPKESKNTDDLKYLKTEIENNSINIFNNKPLADKINTLLTSYIKKAEAVRNSKIAFITRIKDIRDYAVMFILIGSVFIIAFISDRQKKEIKIITQVINMIAAKNYVPIRNNKLSDVTNKTLEKLEELNETLVMDDSMISIIMNEYGLKDTIKTIFESELFRKNIKFDRIGFAVVQENRIVASVSFSDAHKLFINAGYSIDLETSSLKKLIDKNEIRIIDDLDEYLKKHPDSESTKLITSEGFKSNMTIPLIKDGNVIGVLFFSSFKKYGFTETEKNKAMSIAEILARIFEKNMLIEDLITSTTTSFVKLVEGKDNETGNHVERMSLYAEAITKKLIESDYFEELSYLDVDNIKKFAPLHDIGKVGIKDEILLKPGRLTPEEFEKMKEHTLIGGEVLKTLEKNLEKYEKNFFKIGYEIALYHHEKWDGTGYPFGISGKDIPIHARIVTIADVFDALSSKRVYKEAMSFEESLKLVNSMSGTSFDPEIIKAFNNNIDEIREIYIAHREI